MSQVSFLYLAMRYMFFFNFWMPYNDLQLLKSTSFGIWWIFVTLSTIHNFSKFYKRYWEQVKKIYPNYWNSFKSEIKLTYQRHNNPAIEQKTTDVWNKLLTTQWLKNMRRIRVYFSPVAIWLTIKKKNQVNHRFYLCRNDIFGSNQSSK